MCSGHDLVSKRERENGVFTGALRATELGWKHSGLESRACVG